MSAERSRAFRGRLSHWERGNKYEQCREVRSALICYCRERTPVQRQHTLQTLRFRSPDFLGRMQQSAQSANHHLYLTSHSWWQQHRCWPLPPRLNQIQQWRHLLSLPNQILEPESSTALSDWVRPWATTPSGWGVCTPR